MTIERARELMPRLRTLSDDEVIRFMQETDDFIDVLFDLVEKKSLTVKIDNAYD